MHFIHDEFDAGPDDEIEVILNGKANVLLLDPENFDLYKNGKEYRYRGGFAEHSPFHLVPPHQGRWHVVVNLGGHTGHVRAGVRLLHGVDPARSG